MNNEKEIQSIHTISWIIEHRIERPTSLNFLGKIKHASEIIRNKTGNFFIAFVQDLEADTEDSYGIFLFVKDSKFLNWKLSLRVSACFLFENMQLTTLEKGYFDKLTVVTTTNQSTCQAAAESYPTYENHQIWLERNKLLDISDRKVEGLHSTHFVFNETITYQGRVTDISSSEKAIFELDNKVLFYQCFLSRITEICSASVDDVIVIHNVHLFRKASCLLLIACGLTSVEFINPIKAVKKPNNTNIFLKILHQLNLNSLEYDWIIDVYHYLLKSLCPAIVSEEKIKRIKNGSSSSGILESLFLTRSLLFNDLLIPKKNRPLLQEFLSRPHDCIPYSKESFKPMAVFVTVVEIRKHYMNKIRPGQNYSMFKNTDCKPYWILVGILETSKRNGVIYLRDQTGSVPCIVAACGSESSNLGENIYSGLVNDYFPDSFFHTWSIGNIVAIEKFQVIVETNDNQTYEDDIDMKNCLDSLYLQFSLSNVRCLGKVSMKPKQKLEANKRKYDVFVEESLKSESNNEKLIEYSLPIWKTNKSIEEKSKVILKSSLCEKHLFLCENKTGIVKINKDERRFYITMRIISLIEGDTSRIDVEKTTTSFQNNTDANQLEFAEPSTKELDPDDRILSNFKETILLVFEEEMICWFNTFYVGQLYQIENCADEHYTSQLKSNLDDNAKKIVHLFNVPQCFIVPKTSRFIEIIPKRNLKSHSGAFHRNIEAVKLFQSHDIMKHIVNFSKSKNTFFGIKISLEHLAENKLINIIGILKKKFFMKANEKSGYSDVSKRIEYDSTIGLIILDLDHPDIEIKAYLNSDVLFIPFGLLPEAVISLTCMQPVFPHQKEPYLRSTVTSCLRVLKLSSQDDRSRENRPSESEVIPRSYIYELYQLLPPSFLLCGQVQSILRVHIVALCSGCNETMVDGCCSYVGCNNQESPVFQAKARFVLDDGSGGIYIHCKDSSVQQLLSLSDSEWKNIREFSSKVGPLTFDKWEESASVLDEVLRLLCSQPRIRQRLLRAHCRRFAHNGTIQRGTQLSAFAVSLEEVQPLQILVDVLAKRSAQVQN